MVETFALQPGWRAIEGEEARGLLGRLKFEMPPDHALAGVELKAIARSESTDSVLFRRLDEVDRVVVVHLTWASAPERNPEFPAIEYEGTLSDFLKTQIT